MNDNEKIKKLYESIRKVDYFELDEKDFNFEEFIKIDEGFFDYVGVDIYDYLLEDFKELESNDKTKDYYLVTLHNGLQFNLHIRYFSSKDAKKLVETKSASAKIKGNNELSENYIKSFSNLEDDEYISMVMFSDQMGRTERTGDVKMSAKELFVSLKKAILHSWIKRGHEKVKSLIMRVDNNDIKRLNFYKLLIEKFLPNFQNVFEDRTTEAKQGYILLIAAK